MRPAKFKFLSALLLSGVVAAASAQTPSSIDFKVSGSPNYPILNTGTGSLVNYDLANDRIDFSVGSTGAYDNPFFCFDFSDPDGPGVTMRATDANGHRVMDSVGLASDLAYDLANDVISTSPSSSVQCFFKSAADGTFGPFGKVANGSRDSGNDLPPCSEAPAGTDCTFFDDDFAVYPKLAISFENLMISDGPFLEMNADEIVPVSPEDFVSYDLVISNNGSADADNVAFQEVFPKSAAFSAGLDDVGGWECRATGNAQCPGTFDSQAEAYVGDGPIRFKGRAFPKGSKLTFTVYREVLLGSEGQINLFAGAVNGPGGNAESATAQATLGVVGDPVAIAFENQPSETTFGSNIEDAEGNPIVVEVVDGNGLRVTTFNAGFVDLKLIGSSAPITLRTDQPIVDGFVSFPTLTTDITGLVPDSQYMLGASVFGSGLQTTYVESEPFQIASN